MPEGACTSEDAKSSVATRYSARCSVHRERRWRQNLQIDSPFIQHRLRCCVVGLITLSCLVCALTRRPV